MENGRWYDRMEPTKHPQMFRLVNVGEEKPQWKKPADMPAWKLKEPPVRIELDRSELHAGAASDAPSGKTSEAKPEDDRL